MIKSIKLQPPNPPVGGLLGGLLSPPQGDLAFITPRRHICPMKQDQSSVETLKYKGRHGDIDYSVNSFA